MIISTFSGSKSLGAYASGDYKCILNSKGQQVCSPSNATVLAKFRMLQNLLNSVRAALQVTYAPVLTTDGDIGPNTVKAAIAVLTQAENAQAFTAPLTPLTSNITAGNLAKYAPEAVTYLELVLHKLGKTAAPLVATKPPPTPSSPRTPAPSVPEYPTVIPTKKTSLATISIWALGIAAVVGGAGYAYNKFVQGRTASRY